MNRRGTEPYARWCERTAEGNPASYSIHEIHERHEDNAKESLVLTGRVQIPAE